MNLAHWLHTSIQSAATELAINRDLQRWRQLIAIANARFESGELLFQRPNQLAHRRASNFDLRPTGGQVTKLRRDIDAGHAYDDSAFHTFGGDMGSSVSRLPVAW
jgi:hypothetical protein